LHNLPHLDLDAMIPWSIVRTLVGIGRTTAWRLRRAGEFPQPRQVGARQFWCVREIAAWQAALPTAGAV
jgi:predicted DNA-binding transcriptional regulator AlpA